jgi:aspartate 1-decarboxylase
MTYAIEGRRGYGDVCINGAAAHLVHEGDIVIVLAYHTVDEETARSARPNLVYVDENNHITRIGHEIVV